MPKQVTCGFQDHGVGIKILKSILSAETQGQQYREGDLVQLDSPPVRIPVDPEVLRKTAVLLLRNREIDECPQRCGILTGGEQGGSAADHIPGPNQVISALVFVTPGFSPRNRKRGDQGAGIGLVLVSEKQTETAVVEVALVTRNLL